MHGEVKHFVGFVLYFGDVVSAYDTIDTMFKGATMLRYEPYYCSMPAENRPMYDLCIMTRNDCTDKLP